MNWQTLPINHIGHVDFGQHLISFFHEHTCDHRGPSCARGCLWRHSPSAFLATFFLGYLLYALIVVPNELGEYMATGSMERLAVAMIWTLQGVLAFPNKLNYDGSNGFQVIRHQHLSWCLATINIFGVVLTRQPSGHAGVEYTCHRNSRKDCEP